MCVERGRARRSPIMVTGGRELEVACAFGSIKYLVKHTDRQIVDLTLFLA